MKFMTELHRAVDNAIKQDRKLEEVVPAGTTTVYGNVVPAKTTLAISAECQELGRPVPPRPGPRHLGRDRAKNSHGDIQH